MQTFTGRLCINIVLHASRCLHKPSDNTLQHSSTVDTQLLCVNPTLFKNLLNHKAILWMQAQTLHTCKHPHQFEHMTALVRCFRALLVIWGLWLFHSSSLSYVLVWDSLDQFPVVKVWIWDTECLSSCTVTWGKRFSPMVEKCLVPMQISNGVDGTAAHGNGWWWMVDLVGCGNSATAWKVHLQMWI